MRLTFEHRIVAGGLAALLPLGGALAFVALRHGLGPDERWVVGAALVATPVLFLLVLRTQIVYRLRTLSSLVGALREEDYSVRIRARSDEGAMGEFAYELDKLTDALRDQRLEALEAAALVRAVVEEIDAAIFAFDAGGRLQLVNRAGEKLLGRWSEQLIGRSAAQLRLDDLLDGEVAETRDIALPGGAGRWLIRRSSFREKGVPHRLLVMSDLSRALREEERMAWQRLLRVLGHELNNSLAPIRSIATSLLDVIAREPRPSDWLDDVERGLSVIGSRTAGLSRFMDAYGKLTRLPRPVKSATDLGALIERVARLDSRTAVEVEQGPVVEANVDADQIEQLLINLVRNAVDATLDAKGSHVRVSWRAAGSDVEITVADEGEGISGTANLFVPFFTTKPGGSGIGLALSRAIAEAHGGTLTLENAAARGAIATLRLPL